MKTYPYHRIFTCLLFLVLASCGVTKDSVCGIYSFVDKKNPEFSEFLHLRSDGTFNFEISNMMSPYPRLHGSWKLQDGNIILNSTNISVLPGAFGGDTLKFNTWAYKASCNRLRRHIYKSRFRTLKKERGNYKTFILNYEPF